MSELKNEEFLSWKEFGNGLGNERRCFQFPENERLCVKVSLKTRCKQSKREISYFEFLLKRNVVFSHIPKYYGCFSTENYIGIQQEIIKNDDGSIALNLCDYIINNKYEKKDEIFNVLLELKSFLLCNNVIPCDLMLSNILMQERDGALKAILIDGLGSTSYVKWDHYIKLLGRKKIERKWARFIDNEVMPRLS